MLDHLSLTVRPAFFRHEAWALGFAAGRGMGGRPPDPENARGSPLSPYPNVLCWRETVTARTAFAAAGPVT